MILLSSIHVNVAIIISSLFWSYLLWVRLWKEIQKETLNLNLNLETNLIDLYHNWVNLLYFADNSANCLLHFLISLSFLLLSWYQNSNRAIKVSITMKIKIQANITEHTRHISTHNLFLLSLILRWWSIKTKIL